MVFDCFHFDEPLENHRNHQLLMFEEKQRRTNKDKILHQIFQVFNSEGSSKAGVNQTYED